MADVVVLGAGPTGLACAMLLARQGLDIVVLDRDAAPPEDPERAWDDWERRSVTQFHQVHYLQPAGTAMLEEHLPAVVARMEAAGISRFNVPQMQAEHLPGGAAGVDFARFDSLTTCRRPLIDYAFSTAARATPEIEVRYGCPAAGVVTGPSAADGVPHVVGVRTESGEAVPARVLVDAAGRRSPLPSMLEAAGGTRPEEEAFEAGFVYNTLYYRGSALPEYLDPPLSSIGSISALTMPGDRGWWSVTLYHSPQDKQMRRVRDTKVFERVVRALPNHAHWADGESQGEVRSIASTANTTRRFVVDGRPCATGVVPVGDAWGYTNPSIGRGITLGLMHAIDVAPAIVEHIDDPGQLAAEWERRTAGRAARWHASTVAFDRIRGPEVEAYRQGQPDPFDPSDPQVAGSRAFSSASRYDAQVLQWFSEVACCFALPEDVIAREGVFERVLDVALSNPPYQCPGPSRAELEDLLV